MTTVVALVLPSSAEARGLVTEVMDASEMSTGQEFLKRAVGEDKDARLKFEQQTGAQLECLDHLLRPVETLLGVQGF